MSALWSIFLTFWSNLPWVAIALMAVFAWLRQKDSKALILQALGSGAFFALVIGRWLVIWLLGMTSASYNIVSAANTIFGFLLFVALAVFAVGYCLEKLRRRGAAGLPVTATRVD